MSALEQVIPEGYKQTEVGVIPAEWGVNDFSYIMPKPYNLWDCSMWSSYHRRCSVH